MFVFVLTNTKINENIQSALHLENIKKLAFWLNGDVENKTINIQRLEQKHDYAC